jgi:HD-GYP domain-containing protein (c-di-GMP phosphodiesterase class II)
MPDTPAPAPARLDTILGALSHALDLTEGAPAGHSLRSAVIGLRLGRELGLDDAAQAALWYALLLKDAGCSSNAARISALYASDDRLIKPSLKYADARRRLSMAWTAFRASAVGAPLAVRVRTLLGIAREPAVARTLIQIRCERGAAIAERLGFPAATCDAIRALDEHWDGQGHPTGVMGGAIPLGARIANLAQTVDVARRVVGVDGALALVRARRGTWFDPTLADRVQRWARDDAFWSALDVADDATLAATTTPESAQRAVSAATVDAIAEAFADIVDAKSPFTYRHSTHVAQWAVAIGGTLGLDEAALARLRRAGLLHDIGKLGVSNRILDKAGPLDAEERAAIQQHPRFTFQVLSRVPVFADIARLAALHHETLDGSGYPWGVTGDALDLEARVLAVADIFEALTADRPYRAGIPVPEVLQRLEAARGTQLDGTVLDALATAVAASASASAPDALAPARAA